MLLCGDVRLSVVFRQTEQENKLVVVVTSVINTMQNFVCFNRVFSDNYPSVVNIIIITCDISGFVSCH